MIVKMILSAIAFILFAPLVGSVMTGITRKASARAQGRSGGSLLQPLKEVIVLLERGKNENSGIQGYYVKVSMIFHMLAGVLFVIGMDLLMVIACIGLGIVFLVLSAYTSGTYYARLGADRLIREMVSATPMMLMVAMGFYAYCGSFEVRSIALNGPVAFLPMIGIFIGFILIPGNKLRRTSFEYSMPHSMYQRDMNSVTDAFNQKDSAICKIASWYEKTVLYAFTFIFVADGTFWMNIIGVIVCLLVSVLQGLIENMAPKFESTGAFKLAWGTSLVIGVLNLLIIAVVI